MALKQVLWVFGAPGSDSVGQVMLPNQGLPDHVRVSERRSGVCEEMIEVDGFVGSDLEEGQCGGGYGGKRFDKFVRRRVKMSSKRVEDERLDVSIFIIDQGKEPKGLE
jgi:hypothetical protein